MAEDIGRASHDTRSLSVIYLTTVEQNALEDQGAVLFDETVASEATAMLEPCRRKAVLAYVHLATTQQILDEGTGRGLRADWFDRTEVVGGRGRGEATGL